MNSTSTENTVSSTYEYTTFALAALLLFSEVLPFLKKTDGSGLIHYLICMLKGSECMLKKVRETAEQVVNEPQP